jgi:hypothetical protein
LGLVIAFKRLHSDLNVIIRRSAFITKRDCVIEHARTVNSKRLGPTNVAAGANHEKVGALTDVNVSFDFLH